MKVAELNGGSESGFAEVDRASLYYKVVGNGEPLVLIHAGIADRRMWDGQLGAFAERHRLIRYDMGAAAAATRRRECPSLTTTTYEGCSTPFGSSELAL